MKWRVIAVGKPALGYARSGIAEYLKRLKRYAEVELIETRDNGPDENGSKAIQLSEGCIRIVLDERGRGMATGELADQIRDWQIDGVKRAAVLIGGADGHSDETRAAADLVLRLSDFTLQHELALVVLLEQLYRVHTLIRGEPYHRK